MSADKARAVDINHVALEVADIDAALDFYGQLFGFELRGRGERSAFIDLGDQFIALFKGDDRGPRHSRSGGRAQSGQALTWNDDVARRRYEPKEARTSHWVA